MNLPDDPGHNPSHPAAIVPSAHVGSVPVLDSGGAALRAALREETHDATVIIVAQRVGTIMHAERIVVLDGGAIAGIGTHAELMASCPTYREIVYSQLSEEEAA